jgi:hypothetical protein
VTEGRVAALSREYAKPRAGSFSVTREPNCHQSNEGVGVVRAFLEWESRLGFREWESRLGFREWESRLGFREWESRLGFREWESRLGFREWESRLGFRD